MSDFIIPKGKEFVFNIRVIEKDSFLPQDITYLDTNNSNIKLINSATMACISSTGITISKVSPYTDGLVKITIPSSITSSMIVERGDKVDDYYLKPTYQAVIELVFTDGMPRRIAIINKVYVSPGSC